MSIPNSSTGSISRPVSSRNSRRSPSSGSSVSSGTRREVPVAEPRLTPATGEQHAAVPLEDPLTAGIEFAQYCSRSRACEMIDLDVSVHHSGDRSASCRGRPRETHDGRRAMKVVLLHSALGDSRLWRRQVEALAGAHEVVAPDLPGWGTEPLPTEPFSFVDVVTPLSAGGARRELVRRRGRAADGARASRPGLAARADRLRRPGWDWTQELRDHFAREEAAFESGDLDAATEVNLEFWVAPEHRDEVRPQQRLALELQTAHDEPELIWPEPAPLSSLGMPVLVVVGDQDKRDFITIARHLAEEIDGAELAVVAGAGHLVGLDRPDELNALLLDFLARLRAAPSAPRPQSAGHASIAQSPKRRSVRTPSAIPASGIDPEERAAPSEVAERPRRVERAGPVRRLRRRAARSRAPSRSAPGARSRAALRRAPGTAPSPPRRASRARPAAAPASSRASTARSASVPLTPEPAEPSRLIPVPAQTCAKYVGERHLGALGDERRRNVEAVVRVDPPPARLGDRRAGIEGQPRRMREQVAEGRAREGRPARRDRRCLPRRRPAPPARSRASTPTPTRNDAPRHRARRRRAR